jgi:Mg/Co/Ni transporter MgtE
MVVLGPDGESLGRVRDVVVSISIVRHQPRVLGLVVELLTRRRIFVPILRVTAIEPSAVTLNTANVSLRRFVQRPGEVLEEDESSRSSSLGSASSPLSAAPASSLYL